MGNATGNAQYKEAMKHGLGSVQSGISIEQASKLWSIYDEKKAGVLDTKGVELLVYDLAKASIEDYEARITAVKDFLRSDGTTSEILKMFDVTKDGKVTKEEFMVKATRGVVISSPRLEKLNITIRISDLSSTGRVTVSEAENLWDKYVHGGGLFGAKEAQRMLAELTEKSTQEYADRVTSLKRAMEDPEMVKHFTRAFDVDKDGKISKHEFIVKVLDGYEIPVAPPAKRARTDEDNRWAMDRSIVLEAEEVTLLSGLEAAGQLTVLDKTMVDALNKAVDALNRGIIDCPAGYCAVFSEPRQRHYLLYQPDAKERALALFRKPAPQSKGAWSMHNTFQLPDETPSRVEGHASLLKSVNSVQKAVEGLESGLINCAEDFCAVFSASQKAYFVIYRDGKAEEARAHFENLIDGNV